ncbi:hypothetical protein ACN2MB_004657 [Vibrio parahaemolyticus]|uniref:hypothetical protein n=1 Tax=Vibrio parahaemolyticus TaxID=670 RepID=UPI0011233F84|nr:hypothetical protein [Vibrio parahaemolyticus]
MESIIIFLQILILLALGCMFIFRKYLLSYANEKGKNLATKEDIEGITKKIEGVKHEYAIQLESTKASLMSEISTHGYRYEKEYEVLSLLTECLVDLSAATLKLRPVCDLIDPSQSADERKKPRLSEYQKAQNALVDVREKKRPFFSDDIYQALLEIDKITYEESVDYDVLKPEDGHREYWNAARYNHQEISATVNKAMTKIRDRVREWDSLK